jgi:hypothetical protein
MRSRSARANRRTAPPPVAGGTVSPPAMVVSGPASVAIVAGAKLLRVEPGLHSLIVGPSRAAARVVPGMSLPAVYVTAPHAADGSAVELVSSQGPGDWIGPQGGSIVLRGPGNGGHVLVTAYMLADQATGPLDVELRPVGDAVHPATASSTITVAPDPTVTQAGPNVRAEIILHIERQGDRQFVAGDWAGQPGSRLRVEALAVRPLEMLSRDEIEYKAYAHGGRETPWVTGGRLCGTRGQSLPLIGFAIRLAPHLRDQFDVIYRGSFFASGAVPAVRNGDPCFAPLLNDPLEALEMRIVERNPE